jgi:hypothetical protein
MPEVRRRSTALRTLVLLALGAGLVAACGPKQEAAAEKSTQATPASAPAAAGAAAPLGRRGQRALQPQTLDQMLERTFARFDRVDANGDGKITEDEIDAARPARRGGPAAVDAAAGGDRGRRGGRRGFGGGFGRADADGDGVITRAEVEAQTRTRFERQDTNGDGVVSADEVRARFAGRRDRGNGPDGGEGPNG